jgi:hypothetical protein
MVIGWIFNPFKSEIITNGQQCSELIDLCQFSSSDKWSLLYRGTRDGFDLDDFHSRCDLHSNTLTILKAKESDFIFGGYTTVSWDRSNEWKSDPNAFLFSLTNKDKEPVKMKIKPKRYHNAIHCDPKWGPIFGQDILIANNANARMDSCSSLGFSYKHPRYEFGTDEARTFLAGSRDFQLDEIEVYEKKNKH